MRKIAILLLSFQLLFTAVTAQNMHANEQLIHQFYTAFGQLDYEVMQAAYADSATFGDAVFVHLDADQTRNMWEMLCKNAKDFSLTYADVRANDTTGSATWVATYTFSRTNRKVVNHISAKFVFADGKIVKHADSFKFYKWSRQAFGGLGFTLGWTRFFKRKVQKESMKALNKFIESKKNKQ
jgi:ketosteroid isomerase-like protein